MSAAQCPSLFLPILCENKTAEQKKDNDNIIVQVTLKASKPYYLNGVMDWPEHYQSLWVWQKYTSC